MRSNLPKLPSLAQKNCSYFHFYVSVYLSTVIPCRIHLISMNLKSQRLKYVQLDIQDLILQIIILYSDIYACTDI